VLLSSGYAYAAATKDADSTNVIYTNAPLVIAFDASCGALKNLGYKIEKRDAANYFVQASCSNILTGHKPFYARISVTEEKLGTKIACSVERRGAIKTLDVIGYYSAKNIYKEIAKILAQDEISFKKASQVKHDKEARQPSRDETR